jgi:hypothetical protein
MHSPIMGGQTPLPFAHISSTTPLAQSTSPMYGYALSSVPRMQSTFRSPVYGAAYNISTSSPIYSSSSLSRSPDYSIGSGSHRYGSPHSPNYPQSPSGRQQAKD